MSTTFPLLSALIGLPLLGAVGTLLAPDARAAVAAARVAAALTLGVALLVVGAFDPSLAGPQLVERVPWIPAVGASWHVGVDGLGVLFVPLAPLLATAVVFGLDERRVPRAGPLAALVLTLTASLLGVYVALDAVLFFAFWELGLSPTLLLLGLWGSGVARRRLATRVLVTLLVGGVPLLAGLILAARAGGGWQTDLVALASSPPPVAAQGAIAGLLLLGLAVKAPLPPFHGWMPEAMGEGPASLAALVVGFKIGAWGLLRLLVPLAPQAFATLAPWLAAWAAAGALYAGLVALRQPSLRRLVAWLGVSHVGVVVLAVATRDATGTQGALLALAHFPLASSAVVLLAGWLHDRLRTEDLAQVHGLARHAPRFAALLVLGLAAVAGLPGTSGFVGELLALVAAFRAWPVAAGVTVVALSVGAVALVRAGGALLGGPASRPAVAEVRDLTGAEAAPVLLLLAVSVALGLAPSVPLALTAPAADSAADAPAPPHLDVRAAHAEIAPRP